MSGLMLATPELNAIEPSRAQQIKETFMPMSEMLSAFEAAYNAIVHESEKGITDIVCGKAKRCRLDIAKIRIETEKVRKAQKEEYLRAGKAIDGVSNILKWAIEEKETKLKEIENYFAVQEQKRRDALQAERVAMLEGIMPDAGERDLAGMDADVWEAYLGAKQKDNADRVAAEKKAEAERIAAEKAEAEERERIKAENERLKREAQEESRRRAEEEAKRRMKEAAERKAREDAERKTREAHEAELKAEREKAEAARRDIEAREAAERKAREDAEAAEQAELAKGDAEKLQDLICALEASMEIGPFKNARIRADVSSAHAAIETIISGLKKGKTA